MSKRSATVGLWLSGIWTMLDILNDSPQERYQGRLCFYAISWWNCYHVLNSKYDRWMWRLRWKVVWMNYYFVQRRHEVWQLFGKCAELNCCKSLFIRFVFSLLRYNLFAWQQPAANTEPAGAKSRIAVGRAVPIAYFQRLRGRLSKVACFMGKTRAAYVL